MLIWSRLINAIPILTPKEIEIRRIVNIHMKNLLVLFLIKGKPIQFHFIYYGYGAFLTLTPLIGKSFYRHKFQKFDKAGGLFLFWIYLIA